MSTEQINQVGQTFDQNVTKESQAESANLSQRNNANSACKNKPVVIVHGGAWQIPKSYTEASVAGVKKAALIAYEILQNNASDTSALDAVEAAVRYMESDPIFDAGVGSCLTETGEVEMDASIMTDTPTLGAVAAITNVKHPISTARALMQTQHCLLVGAGANAFAKLSGQPIVQTSELVTEGARREWESFKKYGHVVHDLFNSSVNNDVSQNSGHDTVGAVALDINGRIACATSTGGITYKHQGRVGDSPIVGAGLFCQRGVGGVSATGHGESILQTVLCKHIIDLMAMRKLPLSEATQDALQLMRRQTAGCGGVVALDASGNWAADFTTSRMAWAVVDANATLRVGIDKGETICAEHVSGQHNL